VRANYTLPDLTSAFAHQDAVLALVGMAALADQQAIVDAALAAGVKWFIPSEFGDDTSVPEVLARVPILQGKVDLVKYLKSKEGEGLSWTSFITNPFFDFGLKVGFLPFDLKTRKATLWDGGEAWWSTITLPAVGRALVKLFTEGDVQEKAKNRYVRIQSFTTTQKEVLAALERATGQKWEVEEADGEALEKEAMEQIGKGDFGGARNMILAPLLNGKRPVADFEKYGLDNDLLLPGNKETVEEEVKNVLGQM
jgi:hypothetical protein